MFKLKPAYKNYIWGGTRLVGEYGKKPDALPLAESWELSAHEHGQSAISGGAYDGMEFGAYLREHPEAAGLKPGEPFPVLVKLIDAAQPLSVQVHPNDAYAMEHENSKGKTELWYILDAEPGAFLYLGLERAVAREEFLRHMESGSVEKLLRRAYVKPGEAYMVEAGTLHGIGKGIVLAEVQQSSDITYRVYDFGRRGADGNPRPLHLAQALDAADLSAKAVAPQKTSPRKRGVWPIAENRYFSVSGVRVKGSLDIPAKAASFQALLCTQGVIFANGLELSKGETAFLSAGEGCGLRGEGMLLLIAAGA
ncbi:MAG: type I phosphomannose isomerase catalytic subunit [Clostridiaceae bacterium]|nr:class I mannose-6-phosphate isomerase [Eubacteriales bacterium]